jgi:hypothetical protein
VRTGLEKIARDGMVRRGCRDDAHGIDLPEQLSMIGNAAGGQLSR